MKEEQLELGMEVTIQDEEIINCLQKADEIEQSLHESESEEDKYLIYRYEEVVEGQKYIS